jgi:hypothetical protein
VNYIKDLSDAVVAMHSCRCSHVRASTVHEAMDGKTDWNGQVEVFKLDGHPKAQKAFAWGYKDDGGEMQYVAVQVVPPIESLRETVQAAIASGRTK